MDNDPKERIDDIVNRLRSRLQMDPDREPSDNLTFRTDSTARESDDPATLDFSEIGNSIFSYDEDVVEDDVPDEEDVIGSGLLFINPDEGVIVDEDDLSFDADNNGYSVIETPSEILGFFDDDDDFEF